MARPIEKTPVLTGIDAKNFRESLFNSLVSRLPKDEIAQQKKKLLQMKNNYKSVVSATNGVFY